jgi:DNA-binding transcriptional regulator YiaG
MSTKSLFKAALARPASARDENRVLSGSRARFLLSAENIRQPVEVVRTLRALGMSLRKAHEMLNRLSNGEAVPVELRLSDPQGAVHDLRDIGVLATPLAVPEVNPKDVRDRFGISQTEFAVRFGLEVDTVQNWEQGRCQLDTAARLLLNVIREAPGVVEQIVSAQKGPKT